MVRSMSRFVVCLVLPGVGALTFRRHSSSHPREGTGVPSAVSEMPKQVIIISDMQFNSADSNCTNLDAIREQYRLVGYPLPRLVFWNVAGRIQDVPARAVDDNIALVSGFSPSILKAVMDAKDLLLGVLLSTLDSDRYARIDW